MNLFLKFGGSFEVDFEKKKNWTLYKSDTRSGQLTQNKSSLILCALASERESQGERGRERKRSDKKNQNQKLGRGKKCSFFLEKLRQHNHIS